MKWKEILKMRIGENVGRTFPMQLTYHLVDELITIFDYPQVPALSMSHLRLLIGGRNPELWDYIENRRGQNGYMGFMGIVRDTDLREIVERFSDSLTLIDITDSRLDFVGDAVLGAVPVHELRRRGARSVDITDRETTAPGALRADDEFFESPDYDIPDPTFVAGSRDIFDRFMRVYTEVEESIGRD